MIATQRINSVSSKIKDYEDFIPVNVLKWKNSHWKTLCPYHLRTDGKEKNVNPGNVIFENFYQSAKAYDRVHSIEVYPSRFQIGKPEYLQWKYEATDSDGDIVCDDDGNINMYTYVKWRNSLWSCEHAIRYPNGIHRRKNTQFALTISKNGVQKKIKLFTN
jgi:hypothetical protein